MFEVLQERRNETRNANDNEHEPNNSLFTDDNWWGNMMIDNNNNNNNITASNIAASSTKYSTVEPLWGTCHPEFNSSNRRISWSTREKDYIKDWLGRNGHQAKYRATELLKHIHKDQNAHNIFHVNHIVDATRIRHGMRSVEEAETSHKSIYYTEW